MKQVFTIGQVARIIQVGPHTVRRWFDSGKLEGYRIPGSDDRRIPRDKLIHFLKKYGMPLGSLEQEGWHKILIVGAEQRFIDRLKKLLPEAGCYRYEIAHSSFEGGIKASKFQPNTILLDFAMGREEALQCSTNIRLHGADQETQIIALANEDESNPEGLTEHGFNEVFKKPIDVALVAERISMLADERHDNMLFGPPKEEPGQPLVDASTKPAGLFMTEEEALGLLESVRYLTEQLGDREDQGVVTALLYLRRVADRIESAITVRTE